jgi:hypothetical protein
MIDDSPAAWRLRPVLFFRLFALPEAGREACLAADVTWTAGKRSFAPTACRPLSCASRRLYARPALGSPSPGVLRTSVVRAVVGSPWSAVGDETPGGRTEIAFPGQKRRIPFWLVWYSGILVFCPGAPENAVFWAGTAWIWHVARVCMGFCPQECGWSRAGTSGPPSSWGTAGCPGVTATGRSSPSAQLPIGSGFGGSSGILLDSRQPPVVKCLSNTGNAGSYQTSRAMDSLVQEEHTNRQ